MRSRKRNRAQLNKTSWKLYALLAIGLISVCIGLTRFVQAGTPSSGTLSPANPLITYTGQLFTVSNPSSPVGETPPACSPATPCDDFALHIVIPAGNTTDYSAVVTIDWTDSGTTTQGAPNSDFDVYVYKSDGITKVGQGPGTTKPEIAIFQALPGDYIVRVVPYDVSPTVAFRGKIELVAAAAVVQPTPVQLPQATGSTPRYQIFTPPKSVLTRTATPAPTPSGSPAAGQPAVPSAGNGTDAGEPSIGASWFTGRILYQSDLTTFRLTFDDSCASSPSAFWEDKTPATSQESLDPIMFTDHGYNVQNPDTNRTIVSHLSGTTSLSSFSDNDGDTWTPDEGGSLVSGIDHQTVGAGPYHTLPGGLPFPKAPGAYPHAVYYCSQENAAASCARSDDGGQTYGPAVPIYNLTQCGNLHGHVKVSPDGTVYVPNNGCGTEQAVVASEDNGVTWQVRHIKDSGTASSDPWVAFGRGDKVPGGRVYFSYALNDGKAMVAVSDDHGKEGTWKSFDVGAAAGVNHTAFPVVIAGDDDRAAVAFLGTAAKGSIQDRAFPGVWYLYIAHTYDGGKTWTTVNATPNDPVQRGGIWLGGGSPPHRNLLDFIGIDVDRQGRVVVGYADGCTGAACVQAPYEATGNSYTALAAIARQTGGRRLFGPDTAATTTATLPGTPYLSVGRDGSVVHLSWSQSDNGGSAITSYKILRGTTSGGETLLATIAGTATRYDDTAATSPTATYYYKVVAVNTQGDSCGNNETAAPPMGDSCSGLIETTDPAGDQKGAPANADLDVLSVAMADRVEGGENKLTFKLKVADLSLLVPNRQWRVIWNYPIGPPNSSLVSFTGSYYVGMNSDGGAATFEYGIVSTVETVPTNTSTPSKLGAADSGSFDPTTGIITITVSASKIGGPKAGDIIGTLVARTFSGNGNETVKSQSAVDATVLAGPVDPYTGASYMVVGNQNCPNGTTPTTPTLSISDATVTEGNTGTTNATFTVTLSAASASAVTVKYDTANGTATAGSDYQSAGGTLTFAPGETSKTITVAVNGDTTAESDETFAVNLSNPTNATVADGQGIGTIKNDDQPATPPGISINDAAVTEGNDETADAVFTVTLSSVSSSAVTVNFATADGTAAAGSDYEARTGTLSFAPGETSKTITVAVNGDTSFESNETFFVNLSGATNASITDNQGVGTINNDDSLPTLSINDVTVTEGNSGTINATFTATLSAPSSLAATVKYDTANGTATSGSDYQSSSGTLTFAPGETSKTISVTVNGDTSIEPDETFFVNLSNPTNATIADVQGIGTIKNDDVPPPPPAVQLSAATYTVSEDAVYFTITVTRNNASSAATVDYATSDPAGLANCDTFNGIASQRCDYTLVAGRLRFAAGESSKPIYISVIDDVYAEGSESFTLTLSNPGAGISLGSQTSATLTITDNDSSSSLATPIDNSSFFVRQHYRDFLNREPEPTGLQGWLDVMNNCPSGDTRCDRIEVSAGFYRSKEFQERGYFIYRIYMVGFGRIPHYPEFMPDLSRVSGFQSDQEEEANRIAFIDEFMLRPEFKNRYDSKTQPRDYVNELEKAADVTLSNKEAIIADLEQGRKSRAQTLRAVAESNEVVVKYFRQAFVIMQYFGYLRRDADILYLEWIKTFNATDSYRAMIDGFLNSKEYRQRFGPQP
ncbi:MAG TPA: Calx-beta domain-containing protein [Pyrinomonadaceae bacterium]|nr:Calx-beta domain-containing protein [Pyrinomonadaceae bacterium]